MSSLYRASGLGPAKREATRFISSIEMDKYLFESVVEINKAHVVMLARRAIISRTNVRKILQALAKLRVMPKPSEAEDIHVAIEETVIRRAGKSAGGNLQLAKSRNDQVATAIRMRLRSEVLQTIDLLIDLLVDVQKQIRKHYKTFIVGRTHLQPAEPITYGHYLMAFHDAILRDLERLEEFYARLNLSPMGACALAGTSIPIDRGVVAALLGFDGLIENSLGAVGSRDFVVEFLADMAQLAVNISRLAEDFVFYMTPEVNQLQLPKDLSFTSSIMPQKKNPDVLELIRAKCAVPIGALSQASTILHSLPTSYNLDLQEITPRIWVSSRAMQEVTAILRIVLSGTEVRPLDIGRVDLATITATETANILVTCLQIPFRLAHQIVASAADELSKSGAKQTDLWPELVFRKVQAKLGNQPKDLKAKLTHAVTIEAAVASKRSVGSPAPRETLRLLRMRASILRQIFNRQSERHKSLVSAKRRLQQEVVRLTR